MQKIYVEQESQTETPFQNSSTSSSVTQPQHQYYQGPLYLQPGPQNQLFLVSADYLQQNGQNIQGFPGNLGNPAIQVGQSLPKQNQMIEMITAEQKLQYITNADGFRRPITIQCPYCRHIGITRIQNELSDQGMCCVFLFCITIPILCWIPFYMRECQLTKQFCLNCYQQVGSTLGMI